MRLSQFLLASLALVGKVVDAGALARGPEALYMVRKFSGAQSHEHRK